MEMTQELIQRVHNRMQWVNELAAGTVCGDLQLKLMDYDARQGIFTIEGKTEPYMRNVIHTFHGGCTALVADQAMGSVANSMFSEDGHAPTSQLCLNFHRPMTAGEDLLVWVRIVNYSRRQIHLSAEIYRKAAPDKLCVSATSVFFRTGKE